MSCSGIAHSIGVVAFMLAIASCAGNESSSSPEDAGPPALEDGGADADAGACDGPCRPPVLSCDEASWCPVAAAIDPSHTLIAVWGAARDNVLAVGSGGTILHWDGSAWTRMPAPGGIKNTFFSIWGTGANDIWLGSDTSTLYHATDAPQGKPEFREEPNPLGGNSGPAIHAIWGSGGGDLRLGCAPHAHLHGPEFWANQLVRSSPADAWNQVAGSASVTGIWASAANDVWVVGDNALEHAWQRGMTLHGTGSDASTSLSWTVVDSQAAVALEAIWGSSADDVWTVGDAGTIRHLGADHSRWDPAFSPTRAHLRAIWGTGPKDVWAVGDGGTILYYDGVSWKQTLAAFPDGEPRALNGVWGSSADDVWVVGDGVVLHATGKKIFGGGS